MILNKQTRYGNSHPDGECFCSSTCSAAWIFAFNKFIKKESLQIVFYSCLNYYIHTCNEIVFVFISPDVTQYNGMYLCWAGQGSFDS